VRGRTEGVVTITATFSRVAGSTTVHVRSVVRGSGRPPAAHRSTTPSKPGVSVETPGYEAGRRLSPPPNERL
jgi:hypothetical protein